MSLRIINERLELVSKFVEDRALREDIVIVLRRTFDSQRLVQHFSLGRGDADDLISLVRTIEATNMISNLLQQSIQSALSTQKKEQVSMSWSTALQSLSGNLMLEGPTQLASRVSSAIDEDGLMKSHRLQENDSASIVSMAQEVLQSEGSEEDHSSLKAVLRSKRTTKLPVDQEPEEVETWIMRRT